MFNDDIQHFNGLFKRNKTYIISNGHVQKSNPQYATAHPTLEIVLKKYTTAKEASSEINVDGIVEYNFMKVKDIDPTIHNNETFGNYKLINTIYVINFSYN